MVRSISQQALKEGCQGILFYTEKHLCGYAC